MEKLRQAVAKCYAVVGELRRLVKTMCQTAGNFNQVGGARMAVAQSGHGNVAAGDKSAGKAITFLLPLTTPSVPEKFEFRALHVLKNQRVG